MTPARTDLLTAFRFSFDPFGFIFIEYLGGTKPRETQILHHHSIAYLRMQTLICFEIINNCDFLL